MSESAKAVFLSYASQDAEAAKRICDALRSGGVEIWFDADGGLEHGDEWDAKIRRQIKECVLFIPVISDNTQARHEGYFRIEWELAVQRAMGIASGVPFILPVVIDDTREPDALVPDRFLKVQWTRLPGGEMPPDVLARFMKLWSHRTGVLAHEAAGGDVGWGRRTPPSAGASTGEPAGFGDPALQRNRVLAVAVIIVALLAGGAWWLSRHQSTPAATPLKPEQPMVATPAPPPAVLAVKAKSIAVLPFRNLSPDKENDFFAEGVSEDVLTNLGKIRDLKVISQTSVVQFRDQAQVDLRKISAELGVATVLRGSVRRVANKVKVSAQLIDARSDEQLWSNDYEKELSDIFTIQATIAQEIARALKATLLPREQSQIARRPTDNQEAYDLFLRARQLVGIVDLGSRKARYNQAIDFLTSALTRDPKFADAHALLTMVHGHMYRSSVLDPTPARLALLRAAVDAAVQIAPDLPETKFARGNLYFFGLEDFERALLEYRAAQADLPNDAEICRRIGFTERRLGRWHDALATFERGAELDPKSEDAISSWIQMLQLMRRYPEARDLSTRFSAAFPRLGTIEDALRLQAELCNDLAAIRKQLLPIQNDTRVAFRFALWDSDWATAERILLENAWVRHWLVTGPIVPPVGSNQAIIAFLRGDAAATRVLAEAALTELEKTVSSPRLEPAILMAKATAMALAGRSDEAVRDARSAMARADAADKFDGLMLRDQLGQIYIIAGRNDEALETLRLIFKSASWRGPQTTRYHPVWSRLKSDPRFDEILKSAKPL